MITKKPKILVTFREDGKNGGPYISHKRIIESSLSEKYNFEPLMLKNPRQLRKPMNFFKTVREIKNAKPDFVYLAGLQMEGFLVTLACKIARVKCIAVVHGSSNEAIGFGKISRLIFKYIELFTVHNATAVHGVSDFVSSWDICKKSKYYYGTIYNIADFSKTNSQRNQLKKELGIAKEDIVVTSTGRIIKDKGFDVLCEVANQFKDNKKIKFVVAGDGNYKNEWQSKIESEGMQNQVFLLGYREDIDNILSDSDIFIICTKHETLCNSLLEAATHSLPLVASNVGGIPEIIDNGDNGFLVEAGNVEGFATALRELIEDEKLRTEMGKSAKQKVNNKFSEDVLTKRYDELYEYVLGVRK